MKPHFGQLVGSIGYVPGSQYSDDKTTYRAYGGGQVPFQDTTDSFYRLTANLLTDTPGRPSVGETYVRATNDIGAAHREPIDFQFAIQGKQAVVSVPDGYYRFAEKPVDEIQDEIERGALNPDLSEKLKDAIALRVLMLEKAGTPELIGHTLNRDFLGLNRLNTFA